MKLDRLIVSFFSAFSYFAIRHPRRTLVIAAIITLAAAPGVMRLKLRTDGHALISKNAPEVVYDKSIRDQFGIEDEIVVLIRSDHPDGIFNPGTVQLIRDLTADFARLPGVNASDIMSLATEPGFRFRPGTLVNQTLLEPPLKTKAELDQLRDDLSGIQLYIGTLVSTDGKSTAILIGTPSEGDRTKLYRRILDTIAAKQPAPEDIMVTGAPVAEALLGIHLLEDLGVPKALLGAGAPPHTERTEWKASTTFQKIRLLIAHRVGLVPVAALVMMLIFFVTFRNVLAALVPLPGVVATMLFVFGLMGWFGVPIYLTIAVMPVLLTAISVTNDIYLFNRYFTLLREKPGVSHVKLVKETFDKLVRPVAITSLTSGIGFLSFGFSPLGPVRAFGVVTGIGVLFGLFYSLTVVPAMLVLMNPAWLLSRRRQEGQPVPSVLASGFTRLGEGVVRWRWLVAGLALLITALTPLGLRRLAVQDSWIDAFDPSSEFRRATRLINDQFHGMHLLFVSFSAPNLLTGTVGSSNLTPGFILLPGNLVDDPVLIAGSSITMSIPENPKASNTTNAAPRATWKLHIEYVARQGDQIMARISPGAAASNLWQRLPITDTLRFEVIEHTHVKPDVLQTISALGSFIRERRQYAVGGVLSPADYLSTTRFMVRRHDPNARVLPNDPAEIKLLWDYYRMARGPYRLRQVLDSDYGQSVTTVFLKEANFVDTAKLMADIRAYERDKLAPKGVKLGFAGDVAVSQSLIQGIVTTQLQSLVWSLAGIYALTALLGRSLRWGVYCVLPSALAVLVKLAVMGWVGIPLGVATSMFAAMTLGLGVNCAIHLLEGCGQARAGGAPPAEALRRSMRLTGPPALINTLAVSLGFGVLVLSQMPPNARLGLLVVLGLMSCFVASLLLLPVLLYWWPLKDRQDRHESRAAVPSPGH